VTQPVRLQLSRRKGFNLQALSLATNGLAAVNVARPSRFGNPVTREDIETLQKILDEACGMTRFSRPWQELAVKCFDGWIGGDIPELGEAPTNEEIARELRGRNLACWCQPGTPCHADVLLALANWPICEETSE
jgi:hypothetical protein